MSGSLSRSLRSPRVLVALGLILCIGCCAIFAPSIAPYDPAEQDLLSILELLVRLLQRLTPEEHLPREEHEL